MADDLQNRFLKIFLIVSTYWVVSISLIFLNKWLLSGVDLVAPMWVTGFQCVITLLCCFICSLVSKSAPNLIDFPSAAIDLKIAYKVLPLSVMFVLMIAFNNLTLQYVPIQFYNVARSLSTVFNILLTYTILNHKISINILICCAVIISGFLLGVNTESTEEASFSPLGIVCGVIASFMVAANSIYTSKVLDIVDNNIWRLSLYNNFNATFLFLILILITGEVNELRQSDSIFTGSYWFAMTLSGVAGFSIGAVSAAQIKFTSPLTHNISGTAKSAAQTIIAYFYYSDDKSFLWWASQGLVLGGSAAYARVRQLEMIKAPPDAAAKDDDSADPLNPTKA